ncbi:MAG: nucleotide exchange factor GrpE [Phycisphaerales bacterium]|jgi:molecular chaperone GrpE
MSNEQTDNPDTGNCGEGCGCDASAQQSPDPAADLRAQLEEANSRALRILADFQNYQRRALQNEEVARQQGKASVVGGVVNVMDHFDMALNVDIAAASAEQILAGVRVIREELLKALQAQGVYPLNPQANEEFMPGRHEAVMQQPAEGVDAGRVVATFRVGYAMQTPSGERVLRPAQVSVAPTGG